MSHPKKQPTVDNAMIAIEPDQVIPEQNAVRNNGELQALIRADRDRRLRACAEDLQRVMTMHHCRLIATPGITADGRLSANISIQIIEE